MHDVASHRDVNCMCSKDVQKQLVQTSLKMTFNELFCGETAVENKISDISKGCIGT